MLKSHPEELRYNDLWVDLGNPSKSTFSIVLHEAEKEGLITRNETSYRYVTYGLNIAAYAKWLDQHQSSIAASKVEVNGLLGETLKRLGELKET